jgi:hypothetical protein
LLVTAEVVPSSLISFHLDEGGNMFLQNVGSPLNDTAYKSNEVVTPARSVAAVQRMQKTEGTGNRAVGGMNISPYPTSLPYEPSGHAIFIKRQRIWLIPTAEIRTGLCSVAAHSKG